MRRRFYVVSVLAVMLVIGIIVTADDARSQKAARDPQLDAVAQRIDALSEAAWHKHEVAPLGPAEALLVARRLSLALTGAVPSLEEIRALEKLPEDQRVDAHLERLLASRRFADYFAERLSRAYVGVNQGPVLVFRRRRFVYWLSDAIAAGRPYDDIVADMVAGTGLWTDKPGTNFITAHERDPVQLTARTTRAFLGMRLDCAQCHDHPFAHWKQADFEGLAAFYAGVDQNITGISDSPRPFKPTGRMMMMDADPPASEPRVPFASEALPPDEKRPRAQLARWITSPDNPAFGQAIANRVWTMLLGRSLTESGVDDIEAEERIDGALEVLGRDFSTHGHDLRRLIRIIARTRAFRMRSDGAEADTGAQSRFAAFPIVQLRAEQIAASLVQVSNLKTIDADAHILWRILEATNVSDFVRRYGDAGEEELREQSGTIMQRLVMMNGRIANERTQANLFNAAGRIAKLAPNDDSAVRTAFIVTLTRAPSEAELSQFSAQLRDTRGDARERAMEDIMWALVNATEFSWSH